MIYFKLVGVFHHWIAQYIDLVCSGLLYITFTALVGYLLVTGVASPFSGHLWYDKLDGVFVFTQPTDCLLITFIASYCPVVLLTSQHAKFSIPKTKNVTI